MEALKIRILSFRPTIVRQFNGMIANHSDHVTIFHCQLSVYLLHESENMQLIDALGKSQRSGRVCILHVEWGELFSKGAVLFFVILKKINFPKIFVNFF